MGLDEQNDGPKGCLRAEGRSRGQASTRRDAVTAAAAAAAAGILKTNPGNWKHFSCKLLEPQTDAPLVRLCFTAPRSEAKKYMKKKKKETVVSRKSETKVRRDARPRHCVSIRGVKLYNTSEHKFHEKNLKKAKQEVNHLSRFFFYVNVSFLPSVCLFLSFKIQSLCRLVSLVGGADRSRAARTTLNPRFIYDSPKCPLAPRLCSHTPCFLLLQLRLTSCFPSFSHTRLRCYTSTPFTIQPSCILHRNTDSSRLTVRRLCCDTKTCFSFQQNTDPFIFSFEFRQVVCSATRFVSC